VSSDGPLKVPKLRASVIITTYNRAHLVSRAISSVLAATRPGDEVIVIDDGSVDHTAQVIAAYGDRIRYFVVKHHGAGAARNRGIREARNELVAFLDSDDEWLPGQLELQRSLMEVRADILFAFSNFMSESRGKRVHRMLESWRGGRTRWDEVLGPGVRFSSSARLPPGFSDFNFHVGDLSSWEMADWYFSTITLVVRRKEAGDALHFAEDLPIYEDWPFCGRLAKKGLAAYLDCETAVNYGHNGPRLTDADILTQALAALQVLDRVWGADSVFMSEYGELYRRTVAKWQLRKIEGLIVRGHTRQARAEMRGQENLSLRWPFLLLASLPGGIAAPVVRTAQGARRLCRGLSSASHRKPLGLYLSNTATNCPAC